ncbi:hypothetical protein [Parerythrobacter aestuarii]|uniref:hypothetical protein n=1 Tax=Parerythrobacter aestuarii TaxID=3020909 RepID=UPI0024DE03D3|nr:hypothetical protein [Parerythrobacter aestuarii]
MAAFPILLLPVVAACASPSTDYPSLAVRDAERIAAAHETGSDPGPIEPVPTELAARVSRLRAQADAADHAFLDKLPGATLQLEAARGAAIASKSWASAQTALSELDSHRSTTAIALADLDKMYAERAVALERRDFIDDARVYVAAILARQDQSLIRLQGMIRP